MKQCVDKVEVRKYVKSKIPHVEKHLIPIIDVYESVDEIDFGVLPKQFVMKLSNGSSFNYICYDNSKREIKRIRKRFRLWKRLDYYSIGREWAYKGVQNRIICEKLLLTNAGILPDDYKFYCFDGKVEIIAVNTEVYVDRKRQSSFCKNLYTTSWEYMEGSIGYPNSPDRLVEKPKMLGEMIDFAEALSKDFPAVRVDMYYFDEMFYFGELTFYPASGYQKIVPIELEILMGNKITII